MTAPNEIDTTNKFMVASQGDRILIMRPAINMSHDDAVLLAATLVALALQSTHTFEEVRKAVEGS